MLQLRIWFVVFFPNIAIIEYFVTKDSGKSEPAPLRKRPNEVRQGTEHLDSDGQHRINAFNTGIRNNHYVCLLINFFTYLLTDIY